MQHFFEVYHAISQESLVFSWYYLYMYTQAIYQENTSDKWDIALKSVA